jgi:hypothetical protein
MRDIRSDLKDRAALIENEINAAQEVFDHQLQQLKSEREVRIEGFRMELAAINKLMEAEYRRISTAPEPAGPDYRRGHDAEESAPQAEYRRVSEAAAPGYRRGHNTEEAAPAAEYRRRSAAQVAEPAPVAAAPAPLPLADFLVRRVNEAGPLSKDDLRQLAVRAGYFQDAASATRSVHATLLGIIKGGRVRELPNGALAPASMIDTLRQRRAV